MQIDRRRLLRNAAVALGVAAMPWRGWAAEDGKTRLILLGTKGGPSASPFTGRHLPAQVIIAKGVPYVVDCGLGVTEQLVRAGVPLRQLRHILLTHQHSDHNLELGNLIYTAWATGLTATVDVWGPPPLGEMMQAFFALNRYDIETRIADEGRPDLRKMVQVHEYSTGGLVLQNDALKITAGLVPHPPVAPNFGYRFEAADRTIVLSGDTAYSEAEIALAREADVLVHEAMYAPAIQKIVQRVGNGARLMEHLKAAHTIVEDVGRVAAAAKVKKLVLSHLVPGDDPEVTDEMWLAAARRFYDGPIVVGKDLMEI
jgi:ribonuclease BN (tRNA processing enzyme)